MNWNQAEKDQLLADYRAIGAKTLAMRFGRTVRAVEYMARKLGVARSEPRWTEDEDALIAKLWPDMGIACAVQFPKRTREAVKQRAVNLGVRKVPRLAPAAPAVRSDGFGCLPGGRVGSVFELGGKS